MIVEDYDEDMDVGDAKPLSPKTEARDGNRQMIIVQKNLFQFVDQERLSDFYSTMQHLGPNEGPDIDTVAQIPSITAEHRIPRAASLANSLPSIEPGNVIRSVFPARALPSTISEPARTSPVLFEEDNSRSEASESHVSMDTSSLYSSAAPVAYSVASSNGMDEKPQDQGFGVSLAEIEGGEKEERMRSSP